MFINSGNNYGWPYGYPKILNEGWVCPKCGRVYSPSVAECWHCNSGKYDEPTITWGGTDTTSTSIDIDGETWQVYYNSENNSVNVERENKNEKRQETDMVNN